MRLHNRQVKAEFWEDSKLLRLPLVARVLFQGLFHLADDSGCVEHDPFAFKMRLFRSPLDADITVDRLADYTKQLIGAGLLIPYEAGGKPCLFITHFHRHQTLRSPGRPVVPLPPWVQWIPSETKHRSGAYAVGGPFEQAGPSPEAAAPVADLGQISTDPAGGAEQEVDGLVVETAARTEPVDKDLAQSHVQDHGSVSSSAAVDADPLSDIADYLIGRCDGALLLSSANQAKVSTWISAAAGDVQVIKGGIDAGLRAFQKDSPGKLPRGPGFFTEWVMKAIDNQCGRHKVQATLGQARQPPSPRARPDPVDDTARRLLDLEV
jgi:hypothetical protein